MRRASNSQEIVSLKDSSSTLMHHFRRIRVLFIVNNVSTWPAASLLYKTFRLHPFCDVVVASAESYQSNDTESDTYRKLTMSGISALRLNSDSESNLSTLRDLKPNLIIRQSPWDLDYPEELRTPALSFARLGYIPYFALESVAKHNDSSHDFHHEQLYHRECSVIFAESESSAASFRNAQTQIKDRMIFNVGNLKFQSLRVTGQTVRNSHKVLVYSPHHSIGSDWLRFGSFVQNGRLILDWFDSNPEYGVWFRPHPSLETSLVREYGAAGQELLDSWKADFLQNPRHVLAEDWDYATVLRSTDLILTDGISILFESQIFGTPVIFLERSDHQEFTPQAERLLLGTYRFDSKKSVEALNLAARLLRSKDKHPKRASQFQVLEPNVGLNLLWSVTQIIRKLQTTWY